MTASRHWYLLPVVLSALAVPIALRSWEAVLPAATGGTTSSPEGAAPAARDAAAADLKLQHDCEQTLAALLPRLRPECRGIVRRPFVLAGDLSEQELLGWYEGTVGPAARSMANAYFRAAPVEPITVLLFSDREAYDDHALRLFGDRGVSIFGYYKPHFRTLLLNIGTGGGTLVHELTHALIAFDFPDVPDWFNEGLASLHEQCRIRPDESGIEGLDNWRLPVLQRALAENRLQPLAMLLRDEEFRTRNEGLNYAQARYLCLYLQERGLLGEFYARFRDAYSVDPTGARTLQAVVNRPLHELDADFRDWVRRRPN